MGDFDPAAPASYQFWTRPVLRFGDLDTVGHVDNVASIAVIGIAACVLPRRHRERRR